MFRFECQPSGSESSLLSKAFSPKEIALPKRKLELNQLTRRPALIPALLLPVRMLALPLGNGQLTIQHTLERAGLGLRVKAQRYVSTLAAVEQRTHNECDLEHLTNPP